MNETIRTYACIRGTEYKRGTKRSEFWHRVYNRTDILIKQKEKEKNNV